MILISILIWYLIAAPIAYWLYSWQLQVEVGRKKFGNYHRFICAVCAFMPILPIALIIIFIGLYFCPIKESKKYDSWRT